MDSGMFLPIQMAAVKALELDSTWYTDLNNIYKKRKEIVIKIANTLECTFEKNQQGLFLWAKINTNKYKDGFTLSDEILYSKNVFITPGGIFGTQGKEYIRISLCQPEVILEEALLKLKN
jgi:aspartate/methionine/tyrosine aminotransferase